MRRVNKILMATVAILLCLVLISTSVVSGIFAKFIIQKQTKFSMKIEEFDVVLKITPDEDEKMTKASTKTPVIKRVGNTDGGDVISATFDGVSMTMGDDFSKALKVELSGTPNVPIFFKITCHVEYNADGKYNVPEYVSGEDLQAYMPLGYTITVGSTTEDICRAYHNKDNDQLEEIILRNAYYRLYGTKYDANKCPNVKQLDGTTYMFKNYVADTQITGNVETFYLGFKWPHAYGGTDYSEIATFLSENAANSNIKLVYTFTIEQGEIK